MNSFEEEDTRYLSKEAKENRKQLLKYQEKQYQGKKDEEKNTGALLVFSAFMLFGTVFPPLWILGLIFLIGGMFSDKRGFGHGCMVILIIVFSVIGVVFSLL